VSRHVAADAVVVGGGTSGVNAALQLARVGLDVALLEQRQMGAGGARWLNGVLAWQFERAGLAVPEPPEVHSPGGRTHFVGPAGRRGFTLEQGPTLDVDMRLLNERLLGEARSLGVQLFEHAGTPRSQLEDGRLVAIELTAAEVGGEPTELRFGAPLFVDATGRAGVLRRQHPALQEWCPRVRDDQLCSAAQHNYAVADRDAALRFLEQHGARPGDVIDWLGFAGGFSVLVVHVHQDLDEVSVLTGTLGAGSWGSGTSIVDLLRARQPWIGDRLFGGSGLIPLRRTYDRFTAPGLALVGDAACQVFPAHGSGIGIGLIAGRMLAEAVERDGSIRADEDGDPGSEQTLWDYQAAFMREHGGTLAAYDALRRLSTRLDSPGVQRMFDAGFFDEATAGAGLDQRWNPPEAEALRARARALATRPGLAAVMVPYLARAAAALPIYARYPEVADERELRRWSRAARAVLGG
jgi:flavin-dependent dehydrogenase